MHVPLSYMGLEWWMDCVSCSPWDVHANGSCTIPVTLDDLDIDCLLAVIVSYCSYWFYYFFWLCGLIYFRFEDLNYYPDYYQMFGFITVTVFTFENLSQSCESDCQMCIVYSHWLHFFSGAFADKKVHWIHFKGKRVSFWWSLISRVGFDVQIGAVFLTVSYFLCQFSGSITFLRGLTCHTGKPSASCWSHIFKYR